ncbi:MAG: transcriptional regulator [Bacteroidaceae bacterium]|nr:transcriptional regulator [Bacteroidaceae bacterium]
MPNHNYTEQEILKGFKTGDAFFFRQYFYEYCHMAYAIYDRKYELRSKENLDFMSMAHQYALYLIEHDWKQLEDHSPQVSLCTWMVNGFRYVVLDALKWYRKIYGNISFDEYLRTFNLSYDLRLHFNRIVQEMCDNCLEPNDAKLVSLLLIEGYTIKEVAEKMGVTSSAISQRYKNIRERVVVPYLRNHFDMDMDMQEVMIEESTPDFDNNERGVVFSISKDDEIWNRSRSSSIFPSSIPSLQSEKETYNNLTHMEYDEKSLHKAAKEKRTTPDYITELAPNEIFVFGSNLRGMHGGGAAWIAYKKFGAITGQGVGLQGQSYGIPTMQGGVETIKPYVDEFIEFAKTRPDLTFLVTRIGCGIAGFEDWEISPLFEKAHEVENIVLPEGW